MSNSVAPLEPLLGRQYLELLDMHPDHLKVVENNVLTDPHFQFQVYS